MEKINRREALQKSGRIVVGAGACMTLLPFTSGCANESDAIAAGQEFRKKIEPADIEKLKLTIVYDNNRYKNGLHADWGFSCLVEGMDQTILFDTGRYDTMFMSNLKDLGIDPGQTDIVFLSHEHPDHVGGLKAFLDHRSGISVYMVGSFSSGMKKKVRVRGSEVIIVEDPVKVTKNCLSSGEMKSVIRNEHSLIIDTTGGLVVVTGCAHPGIADMVERAKKLMQKEVLLVLGGFHLLLDSESSIQKIVTRFREMGVRYVAPTHCSGQIARNSFKNVYGDHYLACGVGRIITAGDLPGAIAS